MDMAKDVTEVSAGGFVVSSENPNLVCLMARFNRGGKLEWCIPKGHLEQDETIEQAALREVFEETGLEAEITESLGEVNYQFIQAGQRISKTVHVFLMKQVGGELSFDNDPHKEASELEWVQSSELLTRLSHGNERRIARLAIELIEAQN
jgi:8-oxo-dGTP pyrophosphatase MutT (NUDIX family)